MNVEKLTSKIHTVIKFYYIKNIYLTELHVEILHIMFGIMLICLYYRLARS